MRNITVDSHCCYIKNDTDFEEIIFQKCGKEASDWFRNYTEQFDDVIGQSNELINNNLKLLDIIDKQIKEVKDIIDQIYSTKEIVVTEFKKNDNLDKIELALEVIEHFISYYDREEETIEKDFT